MRVPEYHSHRLSPNTSAKVRPEKQNADGDGPRAQVGLGDQHVTVGVLLPPATVFTTVTSVLLGTPGVLDTLTLLPFTNNL